MAAQWMGGGVDMLVRGEVMRRTGTGAKKPRERGWEGMGLEGCRDGLY